MNAGYFISKFSQDNMDSLVKTLLQINKDAKPLRISQTSQISLTLKTVSNKPSFY